GDATPAPVLLQQQLNKTVLYHFLDPNPFARIVDMTATVQWGDGRSNNNWDATLSVIIVANPAGGFDVLGTHTYPANVVGAMRSVQVVDVDGRVFNDPVLYHFTDGNPNASRADFTATVNWGDGNSNTSADGSGSVAIVA